MLVPRKHHTAVVPALVVVFALLALRQHRQSSKCVEPDSIHQRLRRTLELLRTVDGKQRPKADVFRAALERKLGEEAIALGAPWMSSGEALANYLNQNGIELVGSSGSHQIESSHTLNVLQYELFRGTSFLCDVQEIDFDCVDSVSLGRRSFRKSLTGGDGNETGSSEDVSPTAAPRSPSPGTRGVGQPNCGSGPLRIPGESPHPSLPVIARPFHAARADSYLSQQYTQFFPGLYRIVRILRLRITSFTSMGKRELVEVSTLRHRAEGMVEAEEQYRPLAAMIPLDSVDLMREVAEQLHRRLGVTPAWQEKYVDKCRIRDGIKFELQGSRLFQNLPTLYLTHEAKLSITCGATCPAEDSESVGLPDGTTFKIDELNYDGKVTHTFAWTSMGIANVPVVRVQTVASELSIHDFTSQGESSPNCRR